MSKKSNTFANENDEPTALAGGFHGVPTLTGEAAERFVRMADENYKKAQERKNEPLTKEEAAKQLQHELMFLEYEKSNLKKREERIKELKKIINLAD